MKMMKDYKMNKLFIIKVRLSVNIKENNSKIEDANKAVKINMKMKVFNVSNLSKQNQITTFKQN